MKKILLLFFSIAVVGLTAKVEAQCDIYNVTVNLQSANLVNGNCQIVADVAFDLRNNNGNKKVWINLWKTVDFNAIPFTGTHHTYLDGDMPTLDQLDGAANVNDPVAIIGFNNDVNPVVYLTTYSADPGNITPTVGSSIVKTVGPTINGNATDHIVLTGLSFTAPGLCAGLILQGDVWSSQAASNTPPIHCYVAGISFYGDPTINGLITCTNPRKAVVLLSTVSVAPITVTYNLYLDKGIVGVKDGPDVLAYTHPVSFNISSATPYNSGPLNYTGNNIPIDANLPLLVEMITTAPFGKTSYGMISNSCIPLPVEFKSFTASRNRSNVLLKWETASELNNTGFAVERNINGSWEQIAWVPTQALNGNSDITLAYTYTDLNNTKGITQYRIRQVDMDTKSKFSDVRSVRGENQLGKTIVYPNPTNDGKVNVLFEDAAVTREIAVSDMSGRVVRQIKGITNNNVTIENLQPGVYMIRIVATETGEQVVEKVVVNKR